MLVNVISIDTGKILDAEVMSRYCKCYEKYKNSHPERYEKLVEAHAPECLRNHQGSVPSMENEGVISIFKRSEVNNRLRYTDFYGDGDTKSFSSGENVYTGVKLNKKECIGHVQKRMGSRLRKLVKANKGFGGSGKLNNHMIDKIQNYYGIAIRQNVDTDVSTMKSAAENFLQQKIIGMVTVQNTLIAGVAFSLILQMKQRIINQVLVYIVVLFLISNQF